MKVIWELLALPAVLYATYLAALSLAPNYLYSSFPQPIRFTESVINGELPVEAPRVLLLGDSTAGFNYRADQLPRTLSLAMFAASPVENFYSLYRYLDKLPAPRCLVLSSSFALGYQQKFGFWDTYVFHGFYSWRELGEIYRAESGQASLLNQVRFFAKAFLYRAKLMGIHLGSPQGFLPATAAQNYRENTGSRENLKKGLGTIHLDQWHYEHDEISLAHLHQPFVPNPLVHDYMGRLLRLAAERKIAVHWVQPPVLDSFLDPTVRSHYASLARYLAPMITAFPGNTFNGTLRAYPASLMVNPVHLNTNGADLFTRQSKPLFESCQ